MELALVDTCRGVLPPLHIINEVGEIHSILNKVVKYIAAYYLLLHHLA